MRANLRTRYKKLQEKIESKSKRSKSSKQGIKKADMQAIIVGLPNTGKSSLFSSLTNQKVIIADHAYSTTIPVLGTIDFEDVKIQLIDLPPFPNTDKSLINSTDTILLVVDNLNQIEKSREYLQKVRGKIILIFNKFDLLNEAEKRKIIANLRSKKENFLIFSSITKENLDELKKKIFETFPIHISEVPMIIKQDSSVRDIAEKILKGLAAKIKRVRIWGPSSKFGGQAVGIDHVLKDKDVVEFIA
jgi:hypothetical protein